MAMINRLTIESRLTRDPELRRTQNGTEVTSGSIAYQKANGEADFFDIVAWRENAKVLAKYRKGTRILIEGHLTTRSWLDSKQTKRVVVEIVVDTIRELAAWRSDEKSKESAAPMPAQPVPMADFAIPDEDGGIPY